MVMNAKRFLIGTLWAQLKIIETPELTAHCVQLS